MMASNADIELYESVKQSLEKLGVLSKLRAELQANVFNIVNKRGTPEKTNDNNRMATFLLTEHGHKTLNLVKEFLEYFGLENTLLVLDQEISSDALESIYCGRDKLLKDSNLEVEPTHENGPVLTLLLKSTCSQNSISKTNKSLERQTLFEADKEGDGLGAVNKNELFPTPICIKEKDATFSKLPPTVTKSTNNLNSATNWEDKNKTVSFDMPNQPSDLRTQESKFSNNEHLYDSMSEIQEIISGALEDIDSSLSVSSIENDNDKRIY